MKGSAGAVRRARARDLDRLAALWCELTEHHARLDPLFRLREGADRHVRELLSAQLRDADAAIFVWDEADVLEGFCAVRVGRAPAIHAEVERAELTDVCVRESARRRGVGRALVDAALAWVRGRGVERVEARVAARNREGQGFWRALGFEDWMDVLHRRL